MNGPAARGSPARGSWHGDINLPDSDAGRPRHRQEPPPQLEQAAGQMGESG
jgi:hypothetical protein